MSSLQPNNYANEIISQEYAEFVKVNFCSKPPILLITAVSIMQHQGKVAGSRWMTEPKVKAALLTPKPSPAEQQRT